jgi:hypothetical protein
MYFSLFENDCPVYPVEDTGPAGLLEAVTKLDEFEDGHL